MANFFIRRPIFAWVLAIILMMAGALAILQLPVAQYPTIAPPAVSVSANYPGADAQTVQDTVTQVIEQNMNGIDNLMYMSSTSDSAGSVTITLTFQSGTDPDIAQVQVQNKLQLATPLLPQEVQQQGISVEKSSSSYLMVAGFVSDNPDTTQDDISDYVASNVKDTLSRLNGVGDVQLFGAQYAMRIWLDADLLNKYKLTPVDVINQLKVQNDQIAAGQLGGTPALPGQQLNASIIAQTRLKNPEEFGKVTLRVNSDGSVVRLKDVARVELGGENYNVIARINGKPAAGLGIKLATGANALDTAKAIKAKLAELQPFFPQGMKVLYPYDTTPFVQLSIHEVVKTLFEAIMLVFLVMYLFLQNMRATLIPTIAVPVVLLGTFAILAAFGYSINTLTMFGMVLAIGLLVDDAIVVVENVERVMMEDKLPPKEATEKSMSQIQGALVPFSAFTTSHWVYGSPRLERYNGLPSMEIQGEAAPGTSSGDAMALMENLASKLPAGIGYDWTGMSYQERLSGNQAPALVAISFVVVFLCLAALYESWSIPVSVMLVVPLGIVGVLLAATLFNQKNDVYFMVGLLTTIGLSTKNAILIVEFAKDLMEKEGKGVVEATLMAVRMRLRPILMTSLAFILGVLPLAISNGAGSGAQNAVGIGVMGGMVSATLLAIFFVPVFFVVIRRCFKG
ncbi:efflux RND transporter permease subunit [Escherichia coli]|uniref:efflux RND transporter permease subunit n=1 Tax=Escherichia coli TaxID=562 RepID=UPI0029559182|nr:efflux RND transporter permease subunit [Escherichia coli]CAK0695773.1 multidrug efflux RND transporter permease subunit AcrF [Escherichia coli]